MDVWDLVRCLGILLDNAAEAALEAETPWVEIVLLAQGEALSLRVSNPYAGTIDPDQIWAEAVAGWRCGEKLYLEGTAAEEALVQQEDHKESNPKEGLVLEFLKRKVPIDWAQRDLTQRRTFWGLQNPGAETLVERDRICAAEVWCECLLGDLKLMRKSDTMEINGILSSVPGWERSAGPVRFGSYYGRQRGYVKVATFPSDQQQQSG